MTPTLEALPDLIGLSLDQAEAACAPHGVEGLRARSEVISQTQGRFQPTRLNVHLDDRGGVKEVLGFG